MAPRDKPYRETIQFPSPCWGSTDEEAPFPDARPFPTKRPVPAPRLRNISPATPPSSPDTLAQQASSQAHADTNHSVAPKQRRRQTRFVFGPTAPQRPLERPCKPILKRRSRPTCRRGSAHRTRRISMTHFVSVSDDERTAEFDIVTGMEPCQWPSCDEVEAASGRNSRAVPDFEAPQYSIDGQDNFSRDKCEAHQHCSNENEMHGVSSNHPIDRLALALVSKWIQPKRFVLGLGGERSMFDEQELCDCCHVLGLDFDDVDCAELFQALAAGAGVDEAGPVPTHFVIAALADTTTFRNGGIEFDATAFRDDPIQRRRSTMRVVSRASVAAAATLDDGPRDVPHQKLMAIVAHNEMKPAMMAFVAAHLDFFRAARIVTTGSTGRALESGLGVKIDTKVSSGPLGGDQEIGGMIAQGKVGAVFFFRDPLSAHPHEADISALGRLCDVHDTLVATNPITGEAVIHALSTSALVMEQVTIGSTEDAAKARQSMFDSAVVKAYKKRQEVAIMSAVSSAAGSDPAAQ